MDPLYTVREAAMQLEVGEQRVRQIIAEGRLEIEKFGKNRRFIRIRESAIEKYRAQYKIPAALPAPGEVAPADRA